MWGHVCVVVVGGGGGERGVGGKRREAGEGKGPAFCWLQLASPALFCHLFPLAVSHPPPPALLSHTHTLPTPQGSFENLSKIKAAGVSCPLLCKEFVVEAYQIFKARVSGADAVLLIAAVLPNQVRSAGGVWWWPQCQGCSPPWVLVGCGPAHIAWCEVDVNGRRCLPLPPPSLCPACLGCLPCRTLRTS